MDAPDGREGSDRELRCLLLGEATDSKEGWRCIGWRAGSEPIGVDTVRNVVELLGTSAEIEKRLFHGPGVGDDRRRLLEQPRVPPAVAIEHQARMRVDPVKVNDERELEPPTRIHRQNGYLPELDIDGLAPRTAKCLDVQTGELGLHGVGAARLREYTTPKTCDFRQRLRGLKGRVVQVQAAVRPAVDDLHLTGKALGRGAREGLAGLVSPQMNLAQPEGFRSHDAQTPGRWSASPR
jgi:hypothetical protein